jgi:hypothetical protein
MRVEMLEWIHQAVRDIGNKRFVIRSATIPIEGCKVPWPCDLEDWLDFVLLGFNTSDNGLCVSHMSYPIYRGAKSHPGDGQVAANSPSFRNNATKVNNIPVNYTSNEECRQFDLSSSITDHPQFTHGGFVYYGNHLDKDGYPLVHERNELAVLSYVRFQYLQKKHTINWRSIPRTMVADARQEWLQRKAGAFGDAMLPNPAEMRMLVEASTSMLFPMTRDRLFDYKADSFNVSGGTVQEHI